MLRARRAWGGAAIFFQWSRRLRAADFLVLLGLAGLLAALFQFARHMNAPVRPAAAIDLSAAAIPAYALLSLLRGLIAFAISLGFAVVYGYWAAKDARAERVLIPLLDILQSVPVLGFMPGLLLVFLALFPSSNAGLELASIVMIFTAQAWNMAFSFYQSLKSLKPDLVEAASVFSFNSWERFRCLELPSAAIGLVWNGMISMAGGWFFLMISESFVLGRRDFSLPGLGSYMSRAAADGNARAMALAIAAMMLMIVLLDQVLWRPLAVWSQKFRLDESGSEDAGSSWFLGVVRRARVYALAALLIRKIANRHPETGTGERKTGHEKERAPAFPVSRFPSSQAFARLLPVVSGAALLLLAAAAGLGAVRVLYAWRALSPERWLSIGGAGAATLARVLVSTALGTLWALPAGLAIGLSPRLWTALGPAIQMLASFPAPMLFPAAIAAMRAAGVPLSAGSIVLMLLGTQWYILFNVVAGAAAIPADLLEASRSYGLKGWERFKNVLLPAVFPYLVTGWVTAAGGAWNASIVSEFVTFKSQVFSTWGLGSLISEAAERSDIPTLTAAVVVMSAIVMVFNRFVWRRLYAVAREGLWMTA